MRQQRSMHVLLRPCLLQESQVDLVRNGISAQHVDQHEVSGNAERGHDADAEGAFCLGMRVHVCAVGEGPGGAEAVEFAVDDVLEGFDGMAVAEEPGIQPRADGGGLLLLFLLLLGWGWGWNWRCCCWRSAVLRRYD